MGRMIPLLLACLVLFAPMAVRAGSCELRVNDESGLDAPWPLVGGLPLAKGAVRDAGKIHVVDAQGREVPAQVDVAATYQDGSIRWALISLLGSPRGAYRAEFGDEVRRADVKGIVMAEKDGAITVDTGAARFALSKKNLLIESAGLAGNPPLALWGPGENVAYLTDNQGRTARCAGDKAEIEISTLKSGPLRCVLRTEGWYVTDQGERAARGIARMSFFANSPMVQISHTLVFTEDTNKLWVRDYGIEAPLRAAGPLRATFDVSPAFDETVKAVDVQAGQSASMVQDDYPHFAETGSHFSLSLLTGDRAQELLTGAACGEWCDLSCAQAGITVVVRDLAEQFPKELEAAAGGIRIHLWSARGGKELDFRAPTLIKDYWGKWAKEGVWSDGGVRNKTAQLAKAPSNAQGAGKTHEIWIMPHAGPVDVPRTVKQAHAACKPMLLQADPVFLCGTGAMTWPVQPKDEKRLPAEEALISDFFDRIVLPYRVFPLTGFIAWGSCPYLDYSKRNGRWMADFYRTAWSVDYGVRRHVWGLYARSGERKYYEYAARFNNHCADWDMAHWTAGDVMRGGFGYSYGLIHEPFLWRGPKSLLQIDNSGHDVLHWLFEYYMTGNERALEATREYSDALKKAWNLEAARKGPAQFVLLRAIVGLYTREWDPAFRRMADDLARAIVDLKAPNGLSLDLNGPYGPLYKVDRSALVLYDYWWATGDDHAKQAFLKALDYEYRFNRIPAPTSYQNATAYLFTVAYNWTGRAEYLCLVNQMLKAGLLVEDVRLADELKGVADLNSLERLPYRGAHLNMNYFLGMPTALSCLVKAEGPIPPWPLAAKSSFPTEEVYAVVEKPVGKEVRIGVFVEREQPGEVALRVIGPDGKPVAADIRSEERMPYRPHELKNAPARLLPISFRVTIPAGAPEGVYRIGTGGPESFIVEDASVEKVSLACPEGFWLGPDGLPEYFNVPPGVDALKMFVTHPVTVLRADGSVGMDEKEGRMGDVSVPVEGKSGTWCMKGRARGAAPIRFCPHIRLINVAAIVSGAADRLIQAPMTPPAERPAWSPPAGNYSDGVIGQAVHLAKGRVLKFPRGEKLADGSYQHFPAKEGTVELWYRSDRSSAWLPVKEGETINTDFVRGGSVSLYHRYGFGPWRDNFYSFLDLLTLGNLGRPEEGKRGEIGGQTRRFFRAGEWVHLAAVWKMTEGKRGTEGAFTVYVGGRAQPRMWEYPFVLTGRDTYRLKEALPQITIGCPEGSVDELRISRRARYDKDFEPPRQAFAPDADTAALFHFDGNADGLSGASGEPVEAR